MSIELGDGMAIARLLGDDGKQMVGRLYRWESGDLGIMWTDESREVSFLDRVLDADVLARARGADSAMLVELLEALPIKTRKTD